jgi:hypothetical protein
LIIGDESGFSNLQWRLFMQHPFFSTVLLSAVTCAVLTACGGGSSSNPVADTSATKDETATLATNTNNAAVGATPISTDANKLVYDVIADAGDTWQITLDTKANTFALQVVSTAYDLTDTSGSIVAGTTNGSRTPYTLKNAQGSEIGLLVTDISTRSVAGNLTVGTLKASVTGSADKATSLSKLAGTYNFVRFGRNAGSGLGSPDAGAGQALVSADGTTMTLCLESLVGSDGKCKDLTGTSTPETAELKLSLDAYGRLAMTKDGSAFGLATVLPSNLGKALQMDMYQKNEENVWRTGVFYFAEAKALSQTAVNGQWACAGLGADANTINIAGTAGTAKNLFTGQSLAAVFMARPSPSMALCPVAQRPMR